MDRVPVTYSGCFRDRFAGVGARTLAPIKYFSIFFSVVFKQKIHRSSNQWFRNAFNYLETN